jgi:hypothetical protein
LLDGGAEAGFHRHGQAGPSGDLFLPRPPSGRGVFEAPTAGDTTRAVDHDDLMVIFGPIEAQGDVRAHFMIALVNGGPSAGTMQ